MARIDERGALESIACGATFLAALAYPERAALRDAFAGAILCEAFYKAPAWVEDVAYEFVRLASLMQERTMVESKIRQGVRIINERRLEAAFADWPQWTEMLRLASDCEPITHVPTHASRPMFRAIKGHLIVKRQERRKREGRSRAASSPDGGIGPPFIKTNVWKTSLPVLHMSIALFSSTKSKNVNIDDILYDSQKCADIIRYAERFQGRL